MIYPVDMRYPTFEQPRPGREGNIGGGGGYPIPQYRLKQIGKYRNTVSKIDEIPTDRIYDQSRLLQALSISRVWLPQPRMYQKSTSCIARKREKTLIGRTIEKPGHWMPFQFRHRFLKESLNITIKSEVLKC